MKLKEFYSRLKPELDEFDREFRTILKSNVTLIDTVVRYVAGQKGKKLRPVLVLLSGKLCGTINPNVYKAAALVELLHTATLVHDDVVDDSDTRRGIASVNAVFKNKVSVLMGDYFLAKALIEVTETRNFAVLEIISNTARRLARGELLQIEHSRNLVSNEAAYIELISDKTAALISASCQLGAVTTTDDPAAREAMKQFGENLGIAFQIKDDMFDFVGTTSIVGKPVGTDVKESKITLPLVYAFQKAPRKESKEILAQIKKGLKKKEIANILQFVQQTGGLDYAQQKAEAYSAKAKQALAFFPDSEHKQSLIDFLEYNIQREK